MIMPMSIGRVFITWLATFLLMAIPIFTGWFFFKFWGFICGMVVGWIFVILCFEGFCIFTKVDRCGK